MTESYIYDQPFVEAIFHPSDFSVASENAFAHALALALLASSELTILHAKGSPDQWERFPAVRSTLQRWNLLEKGSARAAVLDDLEVRVKKINVSTQSPVNATLDHLHEHHADLIVLATEGRDGLQHWMKPSAAERISAKSGLLTLFVPNEARGFVSRDTGELSLRRILVPVAMQPSPLPALEQATRLASLTGEKTDIVTFFVGKPAQMPATPTAKVPRLSWQSMCRGGEVVTEIVMAAEELDADIIVMATAGHEGFLDALRGTVTEHVLRHASCPLLAVPTT